MVFGKLQLSAMTYTFKCTNEKCNKTLICIMTKNGEREYFGRCEYCKSGRLKWIKNVDLLEVLKDNKIIYKLRRLK
jgi:hypothetical protein|tara:strand:- start:715 stop:942 length:228 start_codon:yes stop_codon:yes gene_type:complete